MILPSSHSPAGAGSRNEGGSERTSEGLEPHDGLKPGPVFVCCLWAHPAPAPGSSVEQGQIEMKDERQAFSGWEIFQRGNEQNIEKTTENGGASTLAVAGIPCLILGLCQGSTGKAVTDGHSGHKSDPPMWLF